MSDQHEDELWRRVAECAEVMDEADKRLAEARLKQKDPATISFKRPCSSTHSEA